MPLVDGLGGVLLYTSGSAFAAMRAFYIDGLGLTPRSDRPGFVNFELGGQRLTVAVHSELSCPNQDPLHVMVNLVTSDAAAVWEALLSHGAGATRMGTSSSYSSSPPPPSAAGNESDLACVRTHTR
jgi:hypothetical protein